MHSPTHSLILLPGLACDLALWQGLLPQLAAAHQVHVSDVHASHDSMPAMVDALLLRHPGAHVWVGSSMGGMLALQLALQAPQRVQGLAVLGSSARADTPELLALRQAAVAEFEAGRMDAVLQANVPLAFHPHGAARPDVVDAYLAMVRRAGSAALVRQNRAVMARPDLRPLLPSIRCPLLVACGEADRLTPPEHSREIAAAVPQARLEIVPGCGHLLTMEQPERVAALLLSWLGTLPKAADDLGAQPRD
jgi:pimeloyl-ACP methyl ester carboxylesterase